MNDVSAMTSPMRSRSGVGTHAIAKSKCRMSKYRSARVVSLLATASAAVMVAGCSADTRAEKLRIDLIDDAIAAVDGWFAGDSSFYEINATSDGVNLFVSVTGSDGGPAVVQARYTSDRGLVVADESVGADGSVFTGAAVDFDAERILDGAIAQLSSSQPRVFIITSASGSGPSVSDRAVSDRLDFRLVVESERGGRLVVLLARDGAILGSDVID